MFRSTKYVRRHAVAFVQRESRCAVIAPQHYNQDGVLCEDEAPVVVESTVPVDLGAEILRALNRATRIKKDLRSAKLTDWPSYRVSGCRSVRQFEADFIRISVSSLNDLNNSYEIAGLPEREAEIRVVMDIWGKAPPELWGERLLKVFAACRDRRV